MKSYEKISYKPLLIVIIFLELFCWHTTTSKLTISTYHQKKSYF